MERKLHLIRAILFEVERHPDPTKAVAIKVPGHAPEQVAYHVGLLREAGYVDAVAPFRGHGRRPAENGPMWLARSLTWAGHELLSATRTDAVWQQVLQRLKDRVDDAPVSVVERLATKIGASMLGVD